MKTTQAHSTVTAPVLHLKVGETLAQAGARAADTLKAVQRGEAPPSHFGVGFEEVGQMFAVFSPKRWELIGALREAGPMTVAQLARHVGRNYKNVHGDVQQLTEWMAVERGDDGRVSVPWASIVVDMKLPQPQAA
jgi:predicted transcriptional regulator